MIYIPRDSRGAGAEWLWVPKAHPVRGNTLATR